MRAFEDYNPAVIFAFFAAAALIAMFSMNPVLLALSLAGSAAMFALRGPGRNWRAHRPYLVLFLVMAAVNPIFSHNGVTVLFVVNDSPVTLEAVLYGLSASAMVVSVLYWFRSFSRIMTSDRLLYLFGSLSPKTALILSMAMRYVPLFREQTKKINDAQKGLGLYKEDNAPDSIRGGFRVFSILVTWALENGITTADSMSARGYGSGRRSYYALYRFRRCDAGLLAAVLALFAAAAAGVGSGALDTAYYPAFSMRAPGPLSAVSCAAYGALVFLPVFLQVEEEIKWKSLRSGI